ncbi:uncharacterized protein LOC129233725 [Uloborus diversus]|uniref:uncharacterized protein LOC129233725 n=1 Tax=Uloborus diversus TaxID=327109 RepID=UPI002409549C|nr:uncharacterized protein LOC129233725 [Uloborus diversus]
MPVSKRNVPGALLWMSLELQVTSISPSRQGRIVDPAAKTEVFEPFDNVHISYDENQVLSSEENSELDHALYDELATYETSTKDVSAKVKDNSVGLASTNSVSLSKPLKKRIIVQNPNADAAAEKASAGKKLHLNRTHISYADLYPESEPVEKVEPKIETEVSPKTSTKVMSQAEKLAMRAKRFNITNSGTTSTKFTKVNSAKPLSLSNAATAPDVDTLKKRAERFGQNVSTVLKQIEEKEKLLKRKLKFGANVSSTSSLDDKTKKMKRAERFGLS